MCALNLSDRFSQIRFLLTIIMLVCFCLHLKKELTKFFEAKTTTATKLENTPTLKLPAITICAEQAYDVNVPGNSTSSKNMFYHRLNGNYALEKCY
jgi:hypothetical protein